MRQFTRPTLNADSNKYFTKWTTSIKRKRIHTTKKKEAHQLWKAHLSTKAREKAVAQLRKMNGDIMHCMYCEHDHAIVEKSGKECAIVDHWQPQTKAPERTFDWTNHFLACYRCNSRLKGEQFPCDLNGQPLLIHPVNDNPLDHIEYIHSTGDFDHISPKGDKTIELFQLKFFSAMRKLVWDALIAALREYDAAIVRGDLAQADDVKNGWLNLKDFRSLLHYLVRIALGPSGDILTGADIPSIITRHDPLATWR